MAVVIARVHDARICGGERQARLLGYRERVHVRAQRDGGPFGGSSKQADAPGGGDVALYLEVQALKY
jgi:hypothetical protein